MLHYFFRNLWNFVVVINFRLLGIEFPLCLNVYFYPKPNCCNFVLYIFFLFIYTFPLSWIHLISLPLYLFYEMSTLISHASKVMLKFSKIDFNSMWRLNFQMFKLDLEKAEEPEIKLPTSLDKRKSKGIPENLLLHWLWQSLWLYG